MQHYRLCLLNVYIACFSLLILPGAGGLAAQAPEGPQEVYTGIYLINVFDLDINRHSFYADCYLWFRWKGERDPMNIEFVNAVDKWGATVEPFYEEAQLQDDGYYYNGMRYEGRFYHPFDLERFPLDEHQLDLQIENVDYPRDSLVYVADSSAAFIREDFHLPGWEILDASFKSHSHKYPVNFGNAGKADAEYSHFTFFFRLRRPLNYFLLKLLLPILIVIIASLGALFIHPSSIDARISLPIGGLLSTVFLQQSYSSALPDVGYMVLMDKIYLLVYALIAGIMLRVVLAGNRVSGLKKAADLEAIRRKDRYLVIGMLVFLALGIGILLY